MIKLDMFLRIPPTIGYWYEHTSYRTYVRLQNGLDVSVDRAVGEVADYWTHRKDTN
jgi:hypothetical protein